MTNHMIGKVLQGRYQIVQSLGAGVFGQTYIAVDIESSDNPKCVIKQLKATCSHPSYLDTLRLHFLTETETLKHLGHHEQIPQLIACFEEHERFYLVQEFIEGHSLTAELPALLNLGSVWSEREVVQFLQDVLGILEFIHSQGVIHCDVKPENLIRRASDGKLVLIDFGSIQPVDFGVDAVLPIYRVPVTSLGYIPPEQFIGQTQPNSDIYALGMIAIQGLTARSPLQLKADINNNVIWRSQNTQVSDYLAAVLSQMIRYNHQDRFLSVSQVLRALREMPPESQQPQAIEAQYSVLGEKFVDAIHADELIADPNSAEETNTSPLLVGMKVGLAANSLVMGLGVYSLLNKAPAYTETEALYKATQEFQAGDLDGALALAKSIPSTSNIYPEAQATIQQWQKQWQIAAEKYLAAEKAFHNSEWSDVLSAAAQVPDILYWQSKTDKLVAQAKTNIEVDTKNLLAKAYEKAEVRDFSTALNHLHQIPKQSSAASLVQKKMAEYNQKQRIRSAYLLQQAHNKAAAGEFDNAIKLLAQVPKDSPVYATAQAKLTQYQEKQRLQAQRIKGDNFHLQFGEDEKVASSKTTASLNPINSFIRNDSATKRQDFQPGDYLNEVNIR